MEQGKDYNKLKRKFRALREVSDPTPNIKIRYRSIWKSSRTGKKVTKKSNPWPRRGSKLSHLGPWPLILDFWGENWKLFSRARPLLFPMKRSTNMLLLKAMTPRSILSKIHLAFRKQSMGLYLPATHTSPPLMGTRTSTRTISPCQKVSASNSRNTIN